MLWADWILLRPFPLSKLMFFVMRNDDRSSLTNENSGLKMGDAQSLYDGQPSPPSRSKAQKIRRIIGKAKPLERLQRRMNPPKMARRKEE